MQKKILGFAIGLVLSYDVLAQKLIPLNFETASKVHQPLTLGKIGSNYFFYQIKNQVIELTVADSALQLKNRRQWLEDGGALLSTNHFQDDSTITFIRQLLADNRIVAEIAILNGQGEEIFRKKTLLKTTAGQDSRVTPFYLAHSKNNTYHLFYEAKLGIAEDSILVHAFLIDKDWNNRKEVSYLLPFNETTEDFIGGIADKIGNIHFLTADKYENYHLSTRVRVNTVALQSETIQSDEILVRNKKLRNIYLNDLTDDNLLELKAIYRNKEKEQGAGFGVIQIPYKRGLLIKTSFPEIEPELLAVIKRNNTDLDFDQSLSALNFFDIRKTADLETYTSILAKPDLNTEKNVSKPVPVNDEFLPKPLPLTPKPGAPLGESVSISQMQQNGLSSLPRLLADRPDLPTPNTRSNKLKPRLQQGGNQSVHIISLQLDYQNGLRNHFAELAFDKSSKNDLLVFNSPNGVFYISYLLDENKLPYLAKFYFNENGKLTTTKIDTFPNTSLILSDSQRINESSFQVSYLNSTTKEVKYGVLTL